VQKLLYAINHEKTETTITKKLNDQEFVVVGTVPHREALLKTIESSGATMLLYRESLKGSTETFELMKMVRTNFPDVRIVFIANEQSAASQLLAKLVFLGIYDIINTDKMYLDDIVDFVNHPRNFGYAEKYFRTEYLAAMLPDIPEHQVEPGPKKKPRLLDSLLAKRPGNDVDSGSVNNSSSSTDFELVRAAMLEEARRVAQAELPKLVELQTKEKHTELTKALEKSESSVIRLQQELQDKEHSERVLKQQNSKLTQQRETAEAELVHYKNESEKTIAYYQDQLRSLQTTQSPEWYQEKMSEWQTERSGYLEKIDQLTTETKALSASISDQKDLPYMLSKVTELEALRDQYQSEIKRLEEELQNAMGAKSETNKSALIAARAQIIMLSNELTALRSGQPPEVSDLQQKLETTSKDVERLSSELSSARAELEQTTAKLVQMNSSNENQITALKAEPNKANAALTEAQNKDIGNSDDFTAIQDELALTKEQLATANEQIVRLKELLDGKLCAMPPHEPNAIESPKFVPNITSRYRAGNGDGRMIAFVGAKPGVGNTTIALNTAVSLAQQGHKTLLVEVDAEYPVIPNMFEFENRTTGLDTALEALAANNLSIAAQDIVKPYMLTPANKDIGQIYKALPPSLHFLNFSTRCSQKNGTSYITADNFKALSYFLLTQEQYSYVIFDVQGNDFATLSAMLTGNCRVHQLFVTTTQDPHSASAAKKLVCKLKQIGHASLIANAYCIVNQFSSQNKMSVKKLAEYLGINEAFMRKLSFDGAGHINANFAALPYRLTKGKLAKEYDSVRDLLVS